jgi:hypothetical protein
LPFKFNEKEIPMGKKYLSKKTKKSFARVIRMAGWMK